MADLNDIINTIIAEANAEGPEGMRRVGETILNRAAIRGIDPAAVVRQPHQYTGYYAPGPEAVKAQRDPEVRSAAEAAWELARQPGDPTGGADHYHANYVNPGWASRLPKTGQYGDHIFYRSREVPAQALARVLAPSAPTPRMPPARGNAPTDLVARSMANVSASRARNRIADMFGPAVTRSTPRLTNAGGVASPTSISTDWANNIFPNTQRRLPAIAAPDLSRAGAVDRVHAGLTQNTSLQDALRRSINSQGTTIASYLTTPSRAVATFGVGKPPATRVVQTTAVSPRDPVGVAPKYGDLAAMFGAQSYNPKAHGFATGKTPDRLPATPGPRINASAPGPALFGGLDPKLAGPAPVPRSPQLAQVARAPKAPVKVPVIEPATAPVRVAQAAPVSPKVPARRPDTIQQAAVTRPTPRTRQAVAIAQPTVMNAYQPAAPRAASPAVAAIASAFNRPAPAPVRPTVYVRGSNTVQPQPQPQQSLWHSDPVGFGNWATSQSGDTSVGNQAEAAAARSSGSGGRSSGSGSGGRRR